MRNYVIKLLGASALLLSLSACEIPVMIAADANDAKMTGMFNITFPAVMLVRPEAEDEVLFTGDMIGHISGSATFSITGPVTGTCNGVMDKNGKGQMSCDNGLVYPINSNSTGRKKMSGVETMSGTVNGTNFVSAFGWGKMANEVAVRAALQ